MTFVNSPLIPSPVSTVVNVPTDGSNDCQGNEHQGIKATIVSSLQRVANSVQPLIKPICIATCYMVSIGIAVSTQMVIAASIRDISNPAPITPMEKMRFQSNCWKLGADLGMLGGAASFGVLGCGIALNQKKIPPQLMIGLMVVVGTTIGGALGNIYSHYAGGLSDILKN